MEGATAADEAAAGGTKEDVPQTIHKKEAPKNPNAQSVARYAKQKIVLSWKTTKVSAPKIGRVFLNDARRSQQVIAWRFGHQV